MLKYLRRGLLAVGFMALSGCGDTANSVLRTATNFKCELTDRLMKVKDEAAAQKFVEVHTVVATDKFKNVDDKWQKWLRDVEGDHTSKKLRLIAVDSKAAPGSPEWRKDADAGSNVDDGRVPETRDAFMAYMKNVKADEKLVNQERERIKKLVNQLVTQKSKEEKKKFTSRDVCPNLLKLTEKDGVPSLLVSGASK